MRWQRRVNHKWKSRNLEARRYEYVAGFCLIEVWEKIITKK